MSRQQVRNKNQDEREPTRAQIDELLRFLPLVEDPAWDPIERWGGGEETADGAITMAYPIYTPDAQRFFSLAGQPCWADYGYQPAEAARMLHDDELIARATLAEIKTMLTYCVRGERFADGHWAAMIESGRIAALLRRLRVLHEQIAM